MRVVDVAGHQQYRYPGPRLASAADQFGAVHARHREISKQQIDPLVVVEARQCVRPAFGFDRPEAELGEVIYENPTHFRIVIRHQYDLVGRHRDHVVAWNGTLEAVMGEPLGPAQINVDRGSLAHNALDRDRAAALLGQSVDLGQSESGALALLLCREERLKHLGEHLLADADTVVDYRDPDKIAA